MHTANNESMYDKNLVNMFTKIATNSDLPTSDGEYEWDLSIHIQHCLVYGFEKNGTFFVQSINDNIYKTGENWDTFLLFLTLKPDFGWGNILSLTLNWMTDSWQV